jgi:hypothetical protein
MLPEITGNLAHKIFDNIIASTPSKIEGIELRQQRELGHAEDVTNWILILDPDASTELLMAGWLHDSERVIDFDGTTGFHGDRNSQAYLDHKKGHAKRSGDLARKMLHQNNWPGNIDRVYFLVLHHDDTGKEIEQLGDGDLVTLAAADSFSFFTYIAPDMLAREGENRLQDKANFMVGKMSTIIRQKLTQVNLDDPTISRVKDKALDIFNS